MEAKIISFPANPGSFAQYKEMYPELEQGEILELYFRALKEFRRGRHEPEY